MSVTESSACILYIILTFLDLAMEVDGIHRGSDNVGSAVPSCHNAGDLIHQLHGHTCSRHTHSLTFVRYRRINRYFLFVFCLPFSLFFDYTEALNIVKNRWHYCDWLWKYYHNTKSVLYINNRMSQNSLHTLICLFISLITEQETSPADSTWGKGLM